MDRDDLGKVVYVQKYEELTRYLTDRSVEVKDALLVGEQLMMLEYTDVNNFKIPACFSNIITAAFTTAHARIKLYGCLDVLAEKCLYFDTDSVVFIANSVSLEEGEFLGDLKCELAQYGEGSHIEFWSGGPKNYACIIQTPTSQVVNFKIKGVKLTNEASQILNESATKDLIVHSPASEIKVSISKIRRNKLSGQLFNRDEMKTYRFTFDKRLILEDLTTLPIGYVSAENLNMWKKSNFDVT